MIFVPQVRLSAPGTTAGQTSAAEIVQPKQDDYGRQLQQLASTMGQVGVRMAGMGEKAIKQANVAVARKQVGLAREKLDKLLQGDGGYLYSLGEEARVLANYLDVDAVAFARLEAVGASGGQRLIGFGNQGQIHLGVSIAHARTGDIEAFFGGNNTPTFGKSVEGIVKKPEKTTGKSAKTAFKKLPGVAEALKPEKLDEEEVRPVQLYDREDEETLLEDLEEMRAD